jgi:hypothetical protein
MTALGLWNIGYGKKREWYYFFITGGYINYTGKVEGSHYCWKVALDCLGGLGYGEWIVERFVGKKRRWFYFLLFYITEEQIQAWRGLTTWETGLVWSYCVRGPS